MGMKFLNPKTLKKELAAIESEIENLKNELSEQENKRDAIQVLLGQRVLSAPPEDREDVTAPTTGKVLRGNKGGIQNDIVGILAGKPGLTAKEIADELISRGKTFHGDRPELTIHSAIRRHKALFTDWQGQWFISEEQKKQYVDQRFEKEFM